MTGEEFLQEARDYEDQLKKYLRDLDQRIQNLRQQFVESDTVTERAESELKIQHLEKKRNKVQEKLGDLEKKNQNSTHTWGQDAWESVKTEFSTLKDEIEAMYTKIAESISTSSR